MTANSFVPGGNSTTPINRNFVSTFDLVQREVSPEIVRRYGNQRLTDIIGRMGMSVVTPNILFEHFEQDRIQPKIKATTAGAGAGAACTFTLSATTPAQIFALAQYNPYLATTTPTYNAGIPVRVNDTIKIPAQSGLNTAATMTEYHVTAVNKSAGTFVAYPKDGTVVTPAIASAIEMIITGNAYGEGSNPAVSLKSGYTHYENNCQIFKEAYTVTGTVNSMTNNYGGVDFTVVGEGETYTRFANGVELALLTGDVMTNQTLADQYQTEPLAYTKGLIPEILDNGFIQGYSLLAGFGISELTNVVNTLDITKGSMENFMYLGLPLSMNMDTQLRDFFKNGAISYGAFNGDKEKAVSLDFNSLTLGNYTFHKRTLEIMSDLQTLGATGFNYKNEGIIVPADAQRDKKTGESISSLRVRYMKDREMNANFIDFAKLGGADKFEVQYLAQKGLEVMGSGRFGYITTT